MSAKTTADSVTAPAADKRALTSLGNAVRARLAADRAVRPVPADGAEIFTVGDFLATDECRRLMAMIDAVARPSPTYDAAAPIRYRTSYSGDFDRTDPLVRAIERRLCGVLGIDPRWGEALQGQRYGRGQEFQAHYDWFDTGAPYWAGEVERGGQRSWTAMAYLNDVERGGATVFPRIGVSMQPQAGALLIWNNALPDGAPNPGVQHAALPVERGIKYVVTKWFRTRPWR